MMNLVAFGVEVIMCFVLVDFAFELRSTYSILIGVFTLSLVMVLFRKQESEKLKQGSYGKIKIHKEPIWRQLMRPVEVAAMLRFKAKGLGISKEEAALDYGLGSLNISKEDVRYCGQKLKQVSRSFATVITFLPNSSKSPVRLAVAIFYLVLRALDTVEDEMDLVKFNPYVVDVDKQGVEDSRLNAKKRLLRGFSQRIRDMIRDQCTEGDLMGIGDGDEKELLENFAIVVRVMSLLPSSLQEVILSVTDEMAQGMADYVARDLKNGTTDAEDFERYCHIVAGTVGDGLTQIFAACDNAPKNLVKRRDLWDSMGSFLQRTNIIRDYLEDLVDGRAWWPKSVWGKYTQTDTLSTLADVAFIESGKSVACLNHMVADALELLPRCLEYLETLQEPHVLAFCALPQVMAIATLAMCYANQEVFRGVVKIRKGQAVLIMLDLNPAKCSTAEMKKSYEKWFLECLDVILAKAKAYSATCENSRRIMDISTKVLKKIQNN